MINRLKPKMDDDIKKNILKTGTSILGIVCKDGIVMAADRRATAGNIVMNKNEIKVFQVNDYLVIAGCGIAADIKRVPKILAAELRLKELRTKQRPSVKEATSLLTNMNYSGIRQPSMIPQQAGFLLAGYNPDGTAELYSIEPAGGSTKVEDYDANFGSGMPFMLGLLERQYKTDITVKEGVELAIEAIKSSTQRDNASGNGIDIYTISKENITKVIAKEITPEFKDR
jgi:proteasome beta subunit